MRLESCRALAVIFPAGQRFQLCLSARTLFWWFRGDGESRASSAGFQAYKILHPVALQSSCFVGGCSGRALSSWDVLAAWCG